MSFYQSNLIIYMTSQSTVMLCLNWILTQSLCHTMDPSRLLHNHYIIQWILPDHYTIIASYDGSFQTVTQSLHHMIDPSRLLHNHPDPSRQLDNHLHHTMDPSRPLDNHCIIQWILLDCYTIIASYNGSFQTVTQSLYHTMDPSRLLPNHCIILLCSCLQPPQAQAK